MKNLRMIIHTVLMLLLGANIAAFIIIGNPYTMLAAGFIVVTAIINLLTLK